MNTSTYTTEKFIKSIEKLPQESLIELAYFLEYLRYKNQQKTVENQETITLETSEQIIEEILVEVGDNLPILSDYAVSRAGIYEEHF